MLLSPQTAIENGWITFPDHFTPQDIANSIQPNAIDFTLDRVFAVIPTSGASGTSKAQIFTDSKYLYSYSEYLPDYDTTPKGRSVEVWSLDASQIYDGMSSFTVKVPESVACTLIVRSTFNRSGLQLNAGLYDQGFNNNIGFMLYPHLPIVIEKGTRIGQIMFHAAHSDGQLYNGSYSVPQNGNHWSTH